MPSQDLKHGTFNTLNSTAANADHAFHQVHADASTFNAGLSKEEAYAQVLAQARALFEGQRNWVCNLANASSLLWHALHALPAPSSRVNWAGFYVLDRAHSEQRQLILGPFQGKVACQTIAFGRGVCGVAAAEKVALVVPDVEKFPGHIACDGESRSEIVVPVVVAGEVVAVIDVDCAVLGGFDDVDRKGLEGLSELLATACDW